MGRHNIQIDFQVFSQRPETNGYTVCVDYAVKDGIKWVQLQCYNRRDIRSKRWNFLSAALTVSDNVAIVQFRVRSLQRTESLYVDNIEAVGIIQEGNATWVPGTERDELFFQTKKQGLIPGYIPKYPRLRNLGI
jgi:hypothetical protein